jgi:hypothetical protein
MMQAKKPKANSKQRGYVAKQTLWHNAIQQLEKAVLDIIPKLSVMSQPGDSNKDYGKHMLTLNYTEEAKATKPAGVGSIRLGMCYDRDSKCVHENRKRCLASQQAINFLLAVRVSMMARLGPPSKGLNWDKFRINTIVGAHTKPHNDNFRGPTPAFLMIHRNQNPTAGVKKFGIRIWRWPEMLTSVVQYKGSLLIPHHYSEARGVFSCIEINGDFDVAGKCSFQLYPCSIIKELEPFGKFDSHFVVCGIKQGKLQVVMNSHYQHYTKFTDIPSPKDLPLVTFAEAVTIASNNPQCVPKDRYRTLTQTGCWHMMFAWRFIHEVVGDPMTPRTHLFFRQIREVCTSSSASPNRSNVHQHYDFEDSDDDDGDDDNNNS